MATSTSNTSLTTFGDITSDQNHLWPSFALSDDDNELERLRAQRRALNAKIAELERRQMIMADIEATPKARANFEVSADERNGENKLFDNSLNSKVEELGKKYDQLETKLNGMKRKKDDRISQIQAENKEMSAKFAELAKKFDQMKMELDAIKSSQLVTENKPMGEFAEVEKIVDEKKEESQKNGENEQRQTNSSIKRSNLKILRSKRRKCRSDKDGEGAETAAEGSGHEADGGRESKDRVRLLRTTTDQGRIAKAWYFLLLHPDRAADLTITTSRAGQTLFCGWGIDPPEDIINAINTKYGLNKKW